MFDFGLGSSELLLIAIVALIVIGPKDLPRLLRTMGQYMRKIQGMAREFQNHLNEAAKETGVDDVKKDIKGMTNFTVTADLDKQGAEIKKAIESSASKATPVNGTKTDSAKSDSAKSDSAKSDSSPVNGADKAKEPAKVEAAKPSPVATSKPVPAAQSATAKSSKPEPKSSSGANPGAKPAAKPKAAPKPAAKAKSKAAPKADRPREAAKS